MLDEEEREKYHTNVPDSRVTMGPMVRKLWLLKNTLRAKAASLIEDKTVIFLLGLKKI